jgi:hypothetical protein
MQMTFPTTVTAKARSLQTFLIRGSRLRPTRFHDEKGTLAIRCFKDVKDCTYAFITAIIRKTLGWRPAAPWIALSALRYVKQILPRDAAIFEWGSGMSTIWYERHYREVHSVEDDPIWYGSITSRTKRAKVYLLDGEAYPKKLASFPSNHFDLVIIDGSQRDLCFKEVMQNYSRLKDDCLIVIDNSDKDQTTHGELWRIDQELAGNNSLDVKRFTGWSHGNFFPQETTVVQRRRGVDRATIHDTQPH